MKRNDTHHPSIPQRESAARGRPSALCVAAFITLTWLSMPLWAESCYTATEMDPTTKAALEQAGRQYFQMAAGQDFAGLKQRAIPSLATNFQGIESAVAENRPHLQGALPAVRSLFLLETTGSGTLEGAEFFCGIYNSPERVTFVIPNLSPGRYAVVIEDVKGGPAPLVLTLVLSEQQGVWRLAGLHLSHGELAGHDAEWFWEKARACKAKGQTHNAWLYYLAAWDLQAPVSFMYTVPREKVSDEMQQIRPGDLPAPSLPTPLTAGARTFNLTQMFPEPVGTDLYLIVKYQASDVSNAMQVTQDNVTVIKALVTRYPELRDAFAGVVARAVEPSGRDYGSLLAMKDIK